EAILGLRDADAGSVRLDDRELLGLGVRGALDAGVGFVPEDRSKDGLISSFTVMENFILDQHDRRPYARGPALQLTTVREKAEEYITAFDVRTSSLDSLASTLSGGNQQKVVLAREMSRSLKLLVASQPTRGLDVGSIEFVHRRI